MELDGQDNLGLLKFWLSSVVGRTLAGRTLQKKRAVCNMLAQKIIKRWLLIAVTNLLYFHSAPWHCLTAVNIDVICEGPGHTKADPRRLDRSMGHHVRRLVLLQHKHRSCLRVSPPSLSQLREIFCKIGRHRLCVCQYNLPSYVVLSLGF